MKTKHLQILLFITLFIFSAAVLPAQKKDGKLKVETGFFGNKYYKGVWSISKEKAFGMLKNNGEAYSLAVSGEKLQKAGSIMGGAGGLLIGFTLGRAAGGAEDPMWFLAGIGGGIVLIGIPIYSTGNKKVHEAVEVYNETEATAVLPQPQKRFIEQVELVGSHAGVGVRIAF